MLFETWLLYISTVFFFLLSPGPSHIFMLSTSFSHGFKKSIATGAGDLSAHVWQTAVASAGLVSLIYTFQDLFIVIKWFGVIFLIYLAVKQFMKKDVNIKNDKNLDVSAKRLYLNGFLMSSSNPKAVIFFAALFPLFVDVTQPTMIQFFILGLTYIVIDGMFLLFYGYFAAWSKEKFGEHINMYLNKISGGLLLSSAFLLALKDIKQQS